jgi:outer membrane protein
MLAQAGFRADAARARARGERSGRWPQLDLDAGILQFATPSDNPTFEWQAGVRLSWGLFSGGARRSSIRRAEAELSAAEHDREAIALELATSEDAARTALESADARVTALAASVGQWEELVRIETLALDAGSGTQRDLLDAQAGLYQARAGHVQATVQAFLARVRLAAAQGRLDRSWILDPRGDS